MESTASVGNSIISRVVEDVNNNSMLGGGGGVVDNEEVGEEEEWLNKRFVFFLLLVVYLLVIVGGVLGNGSILMTLFTSGRVPRNPLLVVLCLSDFFVSGLSAPITVITSAFVQNSWSAGPRTCMTMYFLQVSGLSGMHSLHFIVSQGEEEDMKGTAFYIVPNLNSRSAVGTEDPVDNHKRR